MKAGVIGSGAIGRMIATFLRHTPPYELVGISGDDPGSLGMVSRELGVKIYNLDSLIQASDLVIEATSAKVMPEILRKILAAHKEAFTMSVGGFALDPELCAYVGRQNCHVFVPSGGIAGIDGLLALKEVGLDEVKITTIKSPASLAGAPYFALPERASLLADLTDPEVVFAGSAGDAIREFPANVNLAVTVSLAGIGFDSTRIEIIADPRAVNTRQKLSARAGNCRLETEIQGPPLPENPKSSLVAAASAKALLRQLAAQLQTGS